jgi:hypothetical protein
MYALTIRKQLAALFAALVFAPLSFAQEPPVALVSDPPAAVVETAERASDPSPAVVTVWVGNSGGSGVCVACEDGLSLVLTNRHITGGARSATVTSGGVTRPAVVVAVHPGDDLALVVVRAELPVAALAAADPRDGEAVRLYGYAWNGQGKLVLKEGKASTPDGPHFRSTLAPVSGDSGGGVFNDRGELVSVNHGFEGTYERRGPQLGVRLSTIRAFVRERVADRFPVLAGAKSEPKKDDPPAAKPMPEPQKPGAFDVKPAQPKEKGANPPKAQQPPAAPEYELWRVNGRYVWVQKGKSPFAALPPNCTPFR